MQSRTHNFLFSPNFNWDKDNVFVFPNSDFANTSPSGNDFILTESGGHVLTESGGNTLVE